MHHPVLIHLKKTRRAGFCALSRAIWASASTTRSAKRQLWLKHQTMLVNENRLNLADQRARQYLARQMESFFFGGGAEQPTGYVPPRP